VVRRKAPEQQAGDAKPSRWETASQSERRELQWLLPQRIPLGGICIVEGDTSVGKSTFLAGLAAAVTTGEPWLGRPAQAPRGVLWVTGEEDFATSVKPRLEAAMANMERVIKPASAESGEPLRVSLPESIPAIKDICWEREIDLVILEPLSSMVSSTTDLNSVVSVRACLDPLQRMSYAAGISVILTRGLRKDRTGPRTAHGQGSSAIGDTARSVLVIDRPDPLADLRVLRVVKCSRASGRVPAVSFRIAAGIFGPIMTDLHEMSVANEIDADTIADPAERCVREDARHLLRRMLTDGWIRSTTIRMAAEDAMVSIQTLRRAAADLKVQTRQQWDGQSSYHEWGPPEGGFEHLGTPPVLDEHLGQKPTKPRKKREKPA